jgi:hypothetical protein
MVGLGTGAVLMGDWVGVELGGKGVGTAVANWVGVELGGKGVGTAVVGWGSVELGEGIGVALGVWVGVPLGESVREGGGVVAGTVGDEAGTAQPARIKVASTLTATSHRVENLHIIHLPAPCTTVDWSAKSLLQPAFFSIASGYPEALASAACYVALRSVAVTTA